MNSGPQPAPETYIKNNPENTVDQSLLHQLDNTRSFFNNMPDMSSLKFNQADIELPRIVGGSIFGKQGIEVLNMPSQRAHQVELNQSIIQQEAQQQQNQFSKFEDLFFNNRISDKNLQINQGITEAIEIQTYHCGLQSFDSYPNKKAFKIAINLANLKNPHKANKYYFKELISIIVQQYLGNNTSHGTKDSGIKQELRYLFIQFLALILKKPFISVFNLLSHKYEKKNTNVMNNSGIVAKIQKYISEEIIIAEVLDQIKSQTDEQADEFVNFSDYIDVNDQINELEEIYEQTAKEIQIFWKHWNTPEPNVKFIFEKGRLIARSVSEIKHISQQVVTISSLLFNDAERFNMQILFHQLLLNDPYTSNLMSQQLRVHQMFKSKNKLGEQQKESFNKTGGRSFIDNKFSESGMCLVQAKDGDVRNLRFVYANKTCEKMFGTRLDGENIKNVMPKAVREIHDLFIKDFFTSGSAEIIGKSRNIFFKTCQDIIFPVEFKLQFNHDQRFKHSFLCSFEQMKFLNIAEQQNTKLKISDAMIFLTDEAFIINEISQGVLNMCGFEGDSQLWNNIQSGRGFKFSMSSIIEGFGNFFQKELGENYITKNLNSFRNKIVKLRKFDQKMNDFSIDDTFLGVMHYIEQPLHRANININLRAFIVVPLNKHPEAETLFALPNNESFAEHLAEGEHRGLTPKSINIRFTDLNIEGSQKLQLGKMNPSMIMDGQSPQSMSSYRDQEDGGYDMSSQSSHQSSADSGLDSAYILKSILFQQKTPRILTICIYVLLTILSAFIAVSLYNLVVYLEKHDEITMRIQAYNLAQKRLVSYRHVLLDLKLLHQMSYFNDGLPATKARLRLYETKIKSALEQANLVASQFEEFKIKYKNKFNFVAKYDGVLFLTEVGNIDSRNMTLKHQNLLFSSYVDGLDFQRLHLEQPSINVSNYPFRVNPQTNKSQQTTEVERELYFLFENGVKTMQQVGLEQIQIIVYDSENQISTSIDTLQITTIISVSIVSAILLILLPVLNKLFSRQYVILGFLQMLSKKDNDQLLQRCVDYQRALYQTKNIPIKEEKVPKIIEEEKLDIKSVRPLMEMPAVQRQKKGNTKVVSIDPIQKSHSKQSIKNHNKRIAKYQIEVIDDEQEQEENEDEDVKNYYNKQNGNNNQAQMDVSQLENAREIHKKEVIEAQISQTKIHEKIGILIFIAFCVGYLNSSLFVTQYFGNDVFSTNKDSTQQMRIFFRREICTYNILLYTRENYIQNSSLFINVYDAYGNYQVQDAVDYYINYCLQNEKEISKLINSVPSYLASASDALQNIEGPKFCNTTFGATDPQLAINCTLNHDGLLNKGLEAAMSYIISFTTKLDINYNSDPKKRNQQYLDDSLNSFRLAEIIDLMVLFMREGFVKMQIVVVNSIDSYFVQARILYLVVFSTYISGTLIIAIIFGLIIFNRIKRVLIETQNILVLLPLADLEQQHRAKIEHFLQK